VSSSADVGVEQETRLAGEWAMVDCALAYAKAGWAVFPVRRDKKPFTEHGHLDATCDQDRIRTWWQWWPDANIGLPVPEGYVVLDVDVKDGAHISNLGELPETVIARSGGGGWHVWFRLPENAPEIKGGKALPGIDIRAGGKNYLLVYPSVHPSGQQYEWETKPITTGQVAIIPDRLLDLIRKEAPLPPKAGPSLPGDASKWLDDALVRADYGSRNKTGWWLACQLRDALVSYEDAKVVMLDYQRRVDLPKARYTDQEAMKSLEKAYASPAREKAQKRPDPRTSAPAADDSVTQGLPLSASERGEQVRGSDSPRSPQGEAEGASIHSFIPFIHSGKTDFMRDEWTSKLPDLMATIREVDALPADGIVQHPGTPAIERRRKQYNTLRSAWAIIFPADPLPQTQMSTWLNRAAESAPGMEGEMVLDAMDSFYRAPHNGLIRNPRAAMTAALLNALDPEGQAERRAKKDADRAEYKNEKKAKNAKNAAPGMEAPSPASSEDERWAAAKANCQRLHISLDKLRYNDITGEDYDIDFVERYLRQIEANRAA
jgi:hypothetical protein